MTISQTFNRHNYNSLIISFLTIKSIMKKTISILATIAAVCSMMSCNKTGATPETVTPKPTNYITVNIGMENTRRRLKDMCNAVVEITSVIGEGTTARIIIPKDKPKDKEETK